MANAKKNSLYVKIGVVLLILILVNVVSVRLFSRIDLTSQGLYSLSDASVKLAKNLDDVVTVKGYFSEDLPAPYNNVRRSVLDLLNEYRAYAGKNLQIEFLDPSDPETASEAQAEGIPPLEAQVVEKDKLEVKKVYMGLVFRYEDKKETIPVVKNLSSLEYDISSAIKKLTQKKKKKIGYVQGFGEIDLKSVKPIITKLEKSYDVKAVDLSKSNSVDDDISVLLVLNPTESYSDSAKNALDAFVARGGKLAVMTGKIAFPEDLSSLVGRPKNLNLDDLFANWGFAINQDLVRDAKCATVGVVRQSGGFSIQTRVPFPYLVQCVNFNPDNMIVKDLHNVVLQFCSSIDTSLASSKNIKATVLITSSDRSGRETSNFSLNPFARYPLSAMSEKNIPLAVLFEGSFKSLGYGKNPEIKTQKSPKTSVLVVGSGLFFHGRYAMSPDNQIFLLNAIDYLADDSGLIAIRSKNVSTPSIEEVSDATRNLVKYGDMFLPPILIILIGLFRWRRKVSVKKQLEERL